MYFCIRVMCPAYRTGEIQSPGFQHTYYCDMRKNYKGIILLASDDAFNLFVPTCDRINFTTIVKHNTKFNNPCVFFK